MTETHWTRYEILLRGWGIHWGGEWYFVTPRTLTPGRVTRMALEVLEADLVIGNINDAYDSLFKDAR
jgi:hypothetical protein